jgi:hypothetical protein
MTQPTTEVFFKELHTMIEKLTDMVTTINGNLQTINGNLQDLTNKMEVMAGIRSASTVSDPMLVQALAIPVVRASPPHHPKWAPIL